MLVRELLSMIREDRKPFIYFDKGMMFYIDEKGIGGVTHKGCKACPNFVDTKGKRM